MKFQASKSPASSPLLIVSDWCSRCMQTAAEKLDSSDRGSTKQRYARGKHAKEKGKKQNKLKPKETKNKVCPWPAFLLRNVTAGCLSRDKVALLWSSCRPELVVPISPNEGWVALCGWANQLVCHHLYSLLKKILNSRLFVGRSRLSDSWMQENAMAPFERRRPNISRKRSSEPMTAWFWEGCLYLRWWIPPVASP